MYNRKGNHLSVYLPLVLVGAGKSSRGNEEIAQTDLYLLTT